MCRVWCALLWVGGNYWNISQNKLSDIFFPYELEVGNVLLGRFIMKCHKDIEYKMEIEEKKIILRIIRLNSAENIILEFGIKQNYRSSEPIKT